MSVVASIVGWIVILCVGAAIISFVGLRVWHWFPVTAIFLDARKRERARPARIDWGVHEGLCNRLYGLWGIGSRKNPRWFLGLMRLSDNEYYEGYRTKTQRPAPPEGGE